MLARALFLDRDGVVNVDHPYVFQKENFEFIDGIFTLCRTAVALRYKIFIVTNQAGIGRGYYSEHDFHELTRWMCEVFVQNGVRIDKVYFCPNHPTHGIGPYRIESTWRKPGPGMILQAADEFAINLQDSLLIGNNESDILAAKAAHVGCALLYRPTGTAQQTPTDADFIITELSEASAYF